MYNKVIGLVTLVAACTVVEALKIYGSSFNQENIVGQISENTSTNLSQVSTEDGLHIMLLVGGLYGGYKWAESDVKKETEKQIALKDKDILEAKKLDLEHRERMLYEHSAPLAHAQI